MNTSPRTSQSHPIRIDAIQLPDGRGMLGMSFCPGKSQANGLTGSWSRDLRIDLTRIHEWGAQCVISLIESQEFVELGVCQLPETVNSLGMHWRHAPIRDRDVPNIAFLRTWSTLKDEILNYLNSEKNVFIHCMGGLGRTGMVAAMLLMEAGFTTEEAISTVRFSRPGTIETIGQEAFVRAYGNSFKR